MIDRLYRGDISPCSRNYESNADYQAATKALLAAEDSILACLDEGTRQKLTALTDAYARQQEILCRLSFRDGFCIATGLWRDAESWRIKEGKPL